MNNNIINLDVILLSTTFKTKSYSVQQTFISQTTML